MSRKLVWEGVLALPQNIKMLQYVSMYSFSLFYVQIYFRKLGWQPKAGESHLDAMLRGEVLTALAIFGHDLTLDEALKRFNAFLEDRNTTLLPPDTRKVIECK